VCEAEAARSLGRGNDIRAIGPLINSLGDAGSEVRTQATRSLVKIGRPSVDPLIRVLKKNDSIVQSAAASALGGIGDDMAKEPLIQAFRDGDGDVRHEAVEALLKINKTYSVEPFIEASQGRTGRSQK